MKIINLSPYPIVSFTLFGFKNNKVIQLEVRDNIEIEGTKAFKIFKNNTGKYVAALDEPDGDWEIVCEILNF